MTITTQYAIEQLNKTKLHKWETVTPEMLLDETRSIDGIYTTYFHQKIDGNTISISISAYWSKLAQKVMYSLERQIKGVTGKDLLTFENLTERQAKAILIGLGFELKGGL